MSDDRANKMTFMLLIDGIAPAVVGCVVVTVVVSLSYVDVVDTSFAGPEWLVAVFGPLLWLGGADPEDELGWVDVSASVEDPPRTESASAIASTKMSNFEFIVYFHPV